MKKPVVDLRQFRFSKLNTPEFSHLKYLVGWLGYFAAYFLTENLIPEEKCHVVHCALDDLFPFCEAFVIPYVFWYVMIAGSLLYFAMYNPDSFKKLMTYIIVTHIAAMAIYIIYPNRQDMRPEEFVNDNVFTRVIGLLYSFDTSTNVCPSLHVAYSFGMFSVWVREKGIHPVFKVFVGIAVILICLATVFIKQHSVVDFFVALPVCLLAEIITYGKTYREKWRLRAKN